MVLEVFRKRQKTLMAGLLLLAMFAFVGADLFTRMGRTYAPGERVIATAYNADITDGEIEQILLNQSIAERFLVTAMKRVNSSKLEEFPGFAGNQSLAIEVAVLLRKADQLGITVTPEEINDYIKDWTEGKMGKTIFNEILRGVDPDGAKPKPSKSERISFEPTRLYEAIGQQIRLERVIESLVLVNSDLISGVPTTPLDVYESLRRDYAKVEIDLGKLPTQPFVSTVGEPDETQLRATFDKYKTVAGKPAEGQFGFQVPAKIEADYVSVDVEKFKKDIVLTEEEIKKYYDANPAEFVATAPPTMPSNRTLPGPPSFDENPVPQPKAIPVPPKAAVTPAANPGGNAPPAVTPPVAAPPSTEKKEASPAGAPAKAPVPAKEPMPKTSAWLPGLGPMALTASLTTFVHQAEKQSKSDPPGPPASAPTPPKTTAEASPATDAKVTPPIPPKSAAPAPPNPVVPAPPTLGDAPKPRPLADVRALIVEKLTKQKAIEKALGAIRGFRNETLKNYQEAYAAELSQYRAGLVPRDDGTIDISGFVPPAAPDWKSLAQKAGLEFAKTGAVARDQADKLERIGSANQVVDDSPFAFAGPRFSAIMFRVEPFDGQVFRSADEKLYFLAWKTNDIAARTPTLDEVKPDVVTAWKAEQALDKAKAKAEEWVESIKKADGDWEKGLPKEAGIERIVVPAFQRTESLPEQFAFRGIQSIPLMEIPGVPETDAQLISAIFDMKIGETKAFPGKGGKNYFLVKVRNRQEPPISQFVKQYNDRVRSAEKDVTRLRQLIRGQALPDQFGRRSSSRVLMIYQAKLLVESEAGVKFRQQDGPNATVNSGNGAETGDL